MITDGLNTSLISQGFNFITSAIDNTVRLIFKYPNSKPFKKSTVDIDFKHGESKIDLRNNFK